MEPAPALSLRKAAGLLGLFPSTVAAWLAAGRFPGAVKVGFRWSIPAAAVAELKANFPSTDGRMSVEKAARRLGVKTPTLWRYAREGSLQAVRIGRSWWFTPTAIEMFEKDRDARAEAQRKASGPSKSPPLRLAF